MISSNTITVEKYSTTLKESLHKSSVAQFSECDECPTIGQMGTHIRERIKAARLHACLTQEQLGERIGVSKSAVSMWETANPKKWTRPTYENLQALARITGARIDWLIDDNSEISKDWKAPAELVSFPAERARPMSATDELVNLFNLMDRSEQNQILAYMRTRGGMTKG